MTTGLRSVQLRIACLGIAGLALAGCSGISESTQETIVNVVTLQSGTMSDLKALRGTGPFRTYDVAPDEMLPVLEAAARRARGEGGVPVRAVFVSEIRREVVAKERAGADAHDDGYEKPFRTAMVATVHPIRDRPDQCRVEIHAMRRGPFHDGVVAWERDMPGWIDAALGERRAPPGRIQPIR